MDTMLIIVKRLTYAFFMFSLCLFTMTYSSVMVYHESEKRYDTISTEDRFNEPCISLIQLCENLGFIWKWEHSSKRFDVVSGNTIISLVQDNPFFTVDTTMYQLVYPPFQKNDRLYLSAYQTAMIFSHFPNCTIFWFKKQNRLIYYNEEIDITSRINDSLSLVHTTTNKNGDSADYTTESQKKKVRIEKELIPRVDHAIKTIVLDPGHGGMDPGALGGNKIMEKDVVLAISLALRDALLQDTDLVVFMTRSTDVFIPLSERTVFANEKKADLFISIHANSIGGNAERKKDIHGFKIYFLSQAKNEEDKLVAMRENSVIELEKTAPKHDVLQNILIEMANNEFLTESQELSILIAESFSSTLLKVQPLHKGVGQANFWVLNGAYMPSVLIETCFISNPTEARLLTNKKFQKQIAYGIKEAILKFKKKFEAGL